MTSRDDVERWRAWAADLPEPLDAGARDAQRGIAAMAEMVGRMAELLLDYDDGSEWFERRDALVAEWLGAEFVLRPLPISESEMEWLYNDGHGRCVVTRGEEVDDG